MSECIIVQLVAAWLKHHPRIIAAKPDKLKEIFQAGGWEIVEEVATKYLESQGLTYRFVLPIY